MSMLQLTLSKYQPYIGLVILVEQHADICRH
jgi:hypothetical protein